MLGKLVHQARQFLKITTVPSQMSIDKFCLWMFLENIVLLGDNSFPGNRISIVTPPWVKFLAQATVHCSCQ
jgi:hypothetical protein